MESKNTLKAKHLKVHPHLADRFYISFTLKMKGSQNKNKIQDKNMYKKVINRGKCKIINEETFILFFRLFIKDLSKYL